MNCFLDFGGAKNRDYKTFLWGIVYGEIFIICLKHSVALQHRCIISLGGLIVWFLPLSTLTQLRTELTNLVKVYFLLVNVGL